MSETDMEKTVTIKIKSRMDLDKEGKADVAVINFSNGARAMRAARALGACWLAALFAVLIPFFHFFLVPALFLAGIFMFFQQYGLRMRLVSGKIRCPSCQTEMALRPSAFDWPKREICSNCRADLTLEP